MTFIFHGLGSFSFNQISSLLNFIDFQTDIRPRPSNNLSINHPEVLLNMLSPRDQDKFLQQFSLLNDDQQNYAFRQFLNSRREIQRFAISQFLKLDPETLIVSIQAEIDREKGLRTNSRSDNIENNKPLPQFQPRPTQLNSINKRDNEINEIAEANDKLRRADQEAFRIAKQLQRQQREQLEEIIKQQNRINLQLQSQNVFL